MSRLLMAVLVIAAVPAIAAAQGRPSTPRASRPPREPRIDIGVGGGFAGGLSLGDRDALLRSNTTTGTSFRLFSTDTRIDPSPRLEVRVGYRLSRRLSVEGALAVARPQLTSSLAADAENAVAVDARSTLTEYVVDGGALWRFSTRTRRRWTPFVSGGAGVARHVHERRTLIESGVDGYAGGGLLYALGTRTGVRIDARAHVLGGGIAEGQRVSPRGVLSGSFFVAF